MTLHEAKQLAALLSQDGDDPMDTWCTCSCCIKGLAARLQAVFPLFQWRDILNEEDVMFATLEVTEKGQHA